MSQDEKNLDGLLKRAKWPAASGESTRRLQQSWEREWNGRESRRMWIWPVAAAATIAIGIGATVLLLLNPPRTVPGNISIRVKEEPVAAPVKVAVLEGRPMTMRERIMVGDIRPKKSVPAMQAVKVEETPALRDPRLLAEMVREEGDARRQRELIAELLRGESTLAVPLYLKMVVDVKLRAVALAALDDVKEPPVGALIDELGNGRVAVRFAAARALGRIDGPQTTSELVRLVQLNRQRREALAALIYSGGPDAAEFLEGARNTRGLAMTVRAVEIQMKTVQ